MVQLATEGFTLGRISVFKTLFAFDFGTGAEVGPGYQIDQYWDQERHRFAYRLHSP